jgi:hypothetical protein
MADKKEFKPIALRDLNADQKKTIDRMKEEWFHSVVVDTFFGYWKEYIAWYEGNQYSVYNENKGEIVDIKPLVERETKNVYNRILPMIRQMQGELHYQHEFYTVGATLEREDIRAAKIASSLIEASNWDNGFNAKINEAKMWTLIVGNAYWKEWWDKRLKGLAYAKGGAVEVGGDVNYAFVNPFNIRPDSLAQNRREWRWIVEGKRVPVSEIEREFKLPAGSIKGEGRDGVEQPESFERADIKKSPEPTAARLELWEKPSDQYAKGRFVVGCQDWLCWDDENPTPQGKIPHFHFKGTVPLLGSQWGDSMVKVSQNAQRQLNKYFSLIDEYYENFKPKGLIPFGSLRGGDLKAYKRFGMDFVEFNSRVGAPYFQNPPSLPESIMTWAQGRENEFEVETSVRKPSYGQLPKYASRPSNLLFESLKGQDQSVLFPVIESYEEELIEAIKLRLQIVKEHYTEKRLIKTLGKNRKLSVTYFEGSDLRDNTDVRVVSGVDIFTTKKMKDQVVFAGVEKGMIPIEKAFDVLEIKGMEEFMEEEHIDERQAERHIALMRANPAKYIPENPDDNHEVSYRVFNNFRKTEEFETLDEKTKEDIIKRIAEAKQFMGGSEEKSENPPTEKQVTPVGGEPAVPGMAAVGPTNVPPQPTAAAPPAGEIPPELMEAILAATQGGQL